MVQDGNNDEIAVETITFMQITPTKRQLLLGGRLVVVIARIPVATTSLLPRLARRQQFFDILNHLQGGQRAAHRGPE